MSSVWLEQDAGVYLQFLTINQSISINSSLPGDNPLLQENWNFALDPKSHLSRNARAGDMSRARDSRESGRSFRVKIILLWLDCNLENIFHKTWNHTILHSFSQEAQWHWLPWRFSNKVMIVQGIHFSSLWSNPTPVYLAMWCRPGHGLAALTSAIITIQTVMSSFLKDVTLIYIQKIIVITNFYLSSWLLSVCSIFLISLHCTLAKYCYQYQYKLILESEL